MAVSLGTIKATIQADTSKFDKAMKGSVGKMKGLAMGAAAAGAAVAAMGKAIFDQVQKIADIGDEAAKVSQQLGLTAESYQELGHAAELSGASQASVQAAIRRLGRAANEASQGVAEYKDSFDQVGLSATDAQGNLKSTDVLLMELSDTFQTLESDTQKVALAQDFFGRSGTKLIPMLNQGSAGIQEMRDEARELGIVLSEDATKESEVWNDTITRMKAVMKGARNEAMVPLISEIGTLVDAVASVLPAIGRTIQITLVLGGVLGDLGRVIEVIINLMEWLMGVVLTLAGGLLLNTDMIDKGMSTMQRSANEMADTIMETGQRTKAARKIGDQFYKTSVTMSDGLRGVADQARQANLQLDETAKAAQRAREATSGPMTTTGGEEVGGQSEMSPEQRKAIEERAKADEAERKAQQKKLRLVQLQIDAQRETNEVAKVSKEMAVEIEKIRQSDADQAVKNKQIELERVRANQRIAELKERTADAAEREAKAARDAASNAVTKAMQAGKEGAKRAGDLQHDQAMGREQLELQGLQDPEAIAKQERTIELMQMARDLAVERQRIENQVASGAMTEQLAAEERKKLAQDGVIRQNQIELTYQQKITAEKQRQRDEDKRKADQAQRERQEMVTGIASVATSLGQAAGLSDELQGALSGVGNIATNIASGNVFGAITAGISTIAGFFGGGGSDKKVSRDRTSPRDMARMIAEENRAAFDDLNLRPINLNVDRGTRGRSGGGSGTAQLYDEMAQEAGRR